MIKKLIVVPLFALALMFVCSSMSMAEEKPVTAIEEIEFLILVEPAPGERMFEVQTPYIDDERAAEDICNRALAWYKEKNPDVKNVRWTNEWKVVEERRSSSCKMETY